MKNLHDDEARANRLKQARIDAGYDSVKDAAEALGVGYPTYAGHENGSRGIKNDAAKRYARKFKVSTSWLLFGDDSSQTSTDAPIGIPNLDIHAGLGNGGLGYVEVDPETMRPKPEYTTGDWIFPSDVGARIGVLKGKYAFPVEGDSMSPTIEGGSIVFVDTQRAFPSPPGLFVVDTGDGRLVKRVELVPRSENIRIISDNEKYGSYEFHREDVQVFGRVIAVFSWNE